MQVIVVAHSTAAQSCPTTPILSTLHNDYAASPNDVRNYSRLASHDGMPEGTGGKETVMKKVLASLLFVTGAGMLGCNAAKQAGISALASTSVVAGAWVMTIHNFIGGQTDTVTVVNLSPNGTQVYDVSPVGNISCANGGITYLPGSGPQLPGNSVTGPGVLRGAWRRL